MVAVVKLASQSIKLSWYTKYITETVNVPDMTPISFPDDDIYEDGVVVSIQPDVDDRFSVQTQVQSLSIVVNNCMITNPKVPQCNVNLSSFLQITCFSMHFDIY